MIAAADAPRFNRRNNPLLDALSGRGFDPMSSGDSSSSSSSSSQAPKRRAVADAQDKPVTVEDKPVQIPLPFLKCCVCLEEKMFVDGVILPCGGYIDRRCMEDHMRQLPNSYQEYMCPSGCRTPIAALAVRHFKPMWQVKFDACPSCNHSQFESFYEGEKRGMRTFDRRQCNQCSTLWCPVCHDMLEFKTFGEHRCKDPINLSLLELIRAGQAQPCAFCTAVVQKAGHDCNNITCAMCNKRQEWFGEQEPKQEPKPDGERR